MVDDSRDRTGLAVTWAGHATVLIELDGARLLTDPVLHRRVGPLAGSARAVERGLIEHVDAVLLSHLHADHAHLRSLRTVGAVTRMLAPRGSGALAGRAGSARCTSWRRRGGDASAPSAVQAIEAPAIPRAPRRRRLWPIGVSAEPIGFVVRGSGPCYFAGDTDLFEGLGHWPARSISRCCRSRAGGRALGRVTSIRSGPPPRPRSSARGWPCRSTGAPWPSRPGRRPPAIPGATRASSRRSLPGGTRR